MSSAQNAPFIRYRYDALDRLTGHCQLNDPERLRFYCENRLATEIEGGEQLSIVQHGDQLLAQHQHQNGGVNSTLLATDLQRSVLNALQLNSKLGMAYSVYGHRPFGSGLISSLGFNGQRPEPMTRHYLLGNGYRAFNPVLLRFNSPDNLSPFDKGGFNAYAYCMGDPVNKSDPTGHFPSIRKLSSIIGAKIKSAKTGAHVKPIKNKVRLSEDVYTFEDTHESGSRLTFYGHGSSKHNLMELGDGTGVDGLELIRLAERNGVYPKKFDSVRLMMCHSAESRRDLYGNIEPSFAEKFSMLVGRPVKGFEGEVRVSTVDSGFEKLKIGDAHKGYSYFEVLKNAKALKRTGHRYRPVIFGAINDLNRKLRG